MKDYVSVIAAVISAIFALVCAVTAWKLKNFSDDRSRNIVWEKERRDEIKRLYENTHTLFEQAIRQALTLQTFSLAKEFSETNAKIHLLAPTNIVEQYSKVSHLLEHWSHLHIKASPHQAEIGGQIVTILQAPDPTTQYKEPANAAHEKMQSELQTLIKMLRDELSTHA